MYLLKKYLCKAQNGNESPIIIKISILNIDSLKCNTNTYLGLKIVNNIVYLNVM